MWSKIQMKEKKEKWLEYDAFVSFFSFLTMFFSLSEHTDGCIDFDLYHFSCHILLWFIYTLIIIMLFLSYYFFLSFVFSLTPSYHMLSLLWIGSGKATLQSATFHLPRDILIGFLVVLFVCRTCLESLHIPKLTINLPCKMDYLFMCDLWAPMTYRPNVILKYYNGEMWMRGYRVERETMTQGGHWRERWNGRMEKRGMSVPFIEEGRQTSFIGGSVSPEWCHRGQHRINHLRLIHLLSSSFSLPSSLLS